LAIAGAGHDSSREKSGDGVEYVPQMAQLVADHLDKADQPALIDSAGATSWAELNDRVNRLINHFRAQGVQPGDRVALLAGNRREVFEVLLASGHAGWLVVPINWHFAADEVEYVIENSGAVCLVTDPDHDHLAIGTDIARLTFGAAGSYEAALEAASNEEPTDQMLGGVMFYTSGTTGRPKGVKNTAFTGGVPPEVMKLIAGSMVNVGLPANGRTLLCGPHYHSAQWAFSYMPMINGSTVVLQDKFVPEETLRLIDEHAVTNVHLVPTQFVRMLRVDDATRAAFSGESLQLVLHGAAPCSPDVKRRMLEWWGPKISEYYGATEGGVVTMISGGDWLRKPGSVGQAMPICELKIVPDDGSTAGPGDEGVIHVRNLMGTDFEYLGEPEKTAEAHREPGFFTLGDIGYLDDDGFLFLSDRKIDMIISGGVNIYPAEIEGVLISHPAVVDVAVFGVPNEEFGEEVKAAVQLVDGTAWSEELRVGLEALAREKLAGYKVPRSYDVVAEMPRSEAGKLVKRQLRAPYWEAAGRKI
jgi:long-chain acyl-CoA synthetase